MSVMMRRPTLAGAFLGGWVVMALLVIGLASAFLLTWQRSVAEGACRLRDRATDEAAAHVTTFLGSADGVVRELEQRIRTGRCSADEPHALESCLVAELLAHPHCDELAFTHGGDEVERRWQVAIRRTLDGLLCTRRVHAGAGGFVPAEECRRPDAVLLSAERRARARTADPTGPLPYQNPPPD